MALRRERLARREGSRAPRWDSAFAAARFAREESVARARRAAKRARRSVEEGGGVGLAVDVDGSSGVSDVAGSG